MIAKLRACEHALANGVDDVVIVDGRERGALRSGGRGDSAAIGNATGRRAHGTAPAKRAPAGRQSGW